ncbi:MAG: lysophospholipid acyltransferase family protein [Labilithrix sp.]|nr:lysophospholipid acyltransferase family protein [Labilithrix sp.]MCW5813929.1 lysophospholipid acyltransferase family protein [Labilithrix sp.]
MARADALRADVREGARWSWGQRIKNDAIYMLAMGALAIAERIPPRAAVWVGRWVGLAAWAAGARARRVAIANVARVLPGVDAGSFVRRVYRALGERLGEAVAALDPARPLVALPFVPGARACLDDAIAEGRGVVFASAHLGPWERVAATLVAAGVPLTVVAREPYDPRFGRLYDRLRGARGVKTVYRGADGAGVRLVRVLRRGGVLGMPMDLASRVPSVTAPFLGAPAPTAVGPARLALRTGAAVVVGAATPDGIHFERIVVAPDDDEVALTARINDALSARIRAWPEAWPWMHARWQDNPVMLGPWRKRSRASSQASTSRS